MTLLGLATLLGADMAAGETSVHELPRLVVVATPAALPYEANTPGSATVFSGAFVEQRGVATPAQLAPYVPGFFASDQSVVTPSYSIRGVTTDSVDPRSEERVAVYQDGVPISRTTGSTVALFDLDGVEVHKGPQPTRFLRAAQAGAVSLYSRPPEPEPSASVRLELADYDTRSAQLAVNSPFPDERLMLRVATHLRERDGIVENLTPGAGDLQGEETVALRASLRWQPRAGTTADLILQHQRDTPPGVAFQSMLVPAGGASEVARFGPAELNRGDELGIDRRIQSATLRFDHEVSAVWRLTSTTSGRRFDSAEEYDADGSAFYLLELGNEQRDRQLSHEMRLTHDDGGWLATTLGGGAFWQKSDQTTRIRTDERRAWALLADDFSQALLAGGAPPALVAAAVPALDPFAPEASLPTALPAGFALFANPLLPPSLQALAPLAGRPLANRQSESTYQDAETGAAELFAESLFRPNENWTLGLGARLTREHITSGYAVPDSGTGALGFLVGGGGNDAYRPTPGRLEQEQTATGWTAQAILKRRLGATSEVFASAARGRRSPSLTFDQRSLAPVTLDEEIVWHREAGVAVRTPAGRSEAKASVFHYDYTGFQTRSITGPGTIVAVDGGRAGGRGFEVSAAGRATDVLTFFGSYGYTDATFSALDQHGDAQLYAGNRFRLAALHTFAVGTAATLPAPGGNWIMSPVFHYKSETYFEDDNRLHGGRLRQGGYGVLNLSVGYRPAVGNWSLALYADNLLDREYLVDAGNIGASFGLPTTVRGAPRVLGLRFESLF